MGSGRRPQRRLVSPVPSPRGSGEGPGGLRGVPSSGHPSGLYSDEQLTAHADRTEDTGSHKEGWGRGGAEPLQGRQGKPAEEEPEGQGLSPSGPVPPEVRLEVRSALSTCCFSWSLSPSPPGPRPGCWVRAQVLLTCWLSLDRLCSLKEGVCPPLMFHYQIGACQVPPDQRVPTSG